MNKSDAVVYCIIGFLFACMGIAAIVWSSVIARYSEDGRGGVVIGGMVCLILGLLSFGAGSSQLEEKKGRNQKNEDK